MQKACGFIYQNLSLEKCLSKTNYISKFKLRQIPLFFYLDSFKKASSCVSFTVALFTRLNSRMSFPARGLRVAVCLESWRTPLETICSACLMKNRPVLAKKLPQSPQLRQGMRTNVLFYDCFE